MALEAWGESLSPDLPQTLKRFPLPLLFACAATVLFVLQANNIIDLDAETWFRAMGGLATGAAFAVGGCLFVESRPASRIAGPLLAWVVPVVVAASFAIRPTTWFVPVGLPLVAVLWVSVSAFTADWGRDRRDDAQDRFWWLNHRAIVSAGLVAAAFAVAAIGIAAMERALAGLFGLDATAALYKTLLPVAALFLAPLYWLSTLPRLGDYDARALARPDFVARAIGLVGRFVLVPLILAYGLILYAYAAQIALVWALPSGILGWMVMGFVIAGAGTILVLHPPYLREHVLVRAFRAGWFWLTLLPLLLFALAVYVRIDAYGLTPERLALVWGGVWAIALALAFIAGRGDIRLIPAFAAIAILLATVGPWNILSLPRAQQGAVLETLLAGHGPGGAGAADPAAWQREDQQRARGAIEYLLTDSEGRDDLVVILGRHGYSFSRDGLSYPEITAALFGPNATGEPAPSKGPDDQRVRDPLNPVDLSATPILVTSVYVQEPALAFAGIDFEMRLAGQSLEALRNGVVIATADLAPLLAGSGFLAAADVTFSVDGTLYRLVPNRLTFRLDPASAAPGSIYALDGILYREK